MTSDRLAHPSATAAPLEYDGGSETYHTRYESAEGSKPSRAIVDAIAVIEGREPCERSVTLYDYIDPDALDALFRPCRKGPSRPDGWIEFAFGSYDIRVHADGRLAIRVRQS